MTLASAERAILAEAKDVLGNRKLRHKDIVEWRTSKFDPEEGELLFFLPTIGCYIAVPKEYNRTGTPL